MGGFEEYKCSGDFPVRWDEYRVKDKGVNEGEEVAEKERVFFDVAVSGGVGARSR